jgi:hypothetical protein
VRFRACDDSTGSLFALVSESKVLLAKTVAQASFRRVFGVPGLGCRPYRLSWKVAERFLGVGAHMIRIRVQDAAGEWSNTISKTYRTND